MIMKTVSKNQNNKKINLPYSSNELYLNLFLDWANSDPELFDNKYPELSEGLTREINSHTELLAAMIEKVPQLFPIWLDKADKLIGTAKINDLKNIAGILEKIIKKS